MLVAKIRDFLQLHVLADGDVFHLWRDLAAAGVVHLRDSASGPGATRSRPLLKTDSVEILLEGALTPVRRARAVELDCVRAGLDP